MADLRNGGSPEWRPPEWRADLRNGGPPEWHTPGMAGGSPEWRTPGMAGRPREDDIGGRARVTTDDEPVPALESSK